MLSEPYLDRLHPSEMRRDTGGSGGDSRVSREIGRDLVESKPSSRATGLGLPEVNASPIAPRQIRAGRSSRPLPEEADRMVAVEDLDPPEEEKIKSEPNNQWGCRPVHRPKKSSPKGQAQGGRQRTCFQKKGTAKLKASRTLSITLSIAREHIFGDFLQACC